MRFNIKWNILAVVAMVLMPLYVLGASPKAAPAAALIVSVDGQGFQGITTPPANCATASGFPCIGGTWTNVSCAATVTNNSGGIETSGPCLAAILRCTGTCSIATLPAQVSGNPAIGNSTWTVLSAQAANTQTATAGGTYYDTTVAYSTTYNYVVVEEFSGSGGGVWSAYSNMFQVAVGQAPKATPGPATSVTFSPVN